MSSRKVKKLRTSYELFDRFKKLIVRELAAIGRLRKVSDRYEKAVMKLAEKLRNYEKEYETSEDVLIQFNREEVRILEGLVKHSESVLWKRKKAYDDRGLTSKMLEVDKEISDLYATLEMLERLL